MKRFNLFDQIFGWSTFLIAAVVYLMTIEPTASFWDCGEFIAAAYKLDVGHPPGAPFFMMTARFFTMFASDPSQVAIMVNSMSALLSAMTIAFLFWTITMLARKVIGKKDEELSLSQGIAILGSGLVGALAYTFSDTFWFSAVEGEVYAYSSFFTAVVFWAILRWDRVSDRPYSIRWIIVISYLMGLSIGVHLLNLLAIPAIVLVYYFKNYTINWKNTIIALASACGILLAVLYGLIPGFVKVAIQFELFATNTLSMPFNFGTIIYIIATIAAIIWALYETHVDRNFWTSRISFILAITLAGVPFISDSILLWIIILGGIGTALYKKAIDSKWLNTIVLCVAMMLIGYSSYTMIVVRSMANPPMDQNSPEDMMSLQYYLNREQYGDRPLVYGAIYSAPEVLIKEGNYCIPEAIYGSEQWIKKDKTSENEKDTYISLGRKLRGYEMDSRFKMLFPRIYSGDGSHISAYKEWANITSSRTIAVDRCGETKQIERPGFGDNLKYFFSYQVNFMYWRYFMWNFVGRQNDIQGHGEIDRGNWISGIPAIDNAMLGNQETLPDVFKNNKGKNKYYFLPFILGILGILWQLQNKQRGKENFWVTFTLFFMTGIAIVIYLNQTPYQPRERDYAYAGSFYAFALWIGLGVMAIWDLLNKYLKNPSAGIAATLLALVVPVIMAQQNWDDHDRSGRTTARDFGANYLKTCGEQAIIYTNGDNDTFPLWYNQEVEGFRTDVRVCNLSYLQTDWYIDQMRREAYLSKPLPILWEHKDYVQGTLDVSRVQDHPQIKEPLTIDKAFEYLRRPDLQEDGVGNVFSTTLVLPVDKEKVLASGTVSADKADQIVPQIEIKLKRTLNKAEMMFLEILSKNNWERPIYIAFTVGENYYPNIKKYLQIEGLAYRVVPIAANTNPEEEYVNVEALYDNLMNKYTWGGVSNPNVYLDENNLRMCRTVRVLFSSLATQLIKEGDTERAIKVIDKCFEELPGTTIPLDYTAVLLAEAYNQCGSYEKGEAIMEVIASECEEKLEWYSNLTPRQRQTVSRDFNPRTNLAMIQNIIIASKADSPIKEKYERVMEKYYRLIQ